MQTEKGDTRTRTAINYANDELARAYREAAEAERGGILTEVVRLNEPLVRKVANPFARRGEPRKYEDFLQAGREGLITAFRRYDPDHRGGATTFGAYARSYVQGAVWRAVSGSDGEGETHEVRTSVGAVKKAREALIAETGDPHPSFEAIGAQAGMSAQMVERALRPAHTSLNAPAGEDGDAELGDLIAAPGPDGLSDAALLDLEQRLRDTPLDPMPRRTVVMRFGIDQGGSRDYAEIAHEVGVSRELARKRVENAIALLYARELLARRFRQQAEAAEGPQQVSLLAKPAD